MKWTIRIEFSVDGKEPSSCVVGTITRPAVDVLPEQIGLSLEEGQQLLRGVQMAILGDQGHRYELGRARRSDCGRRQRIKDTRRKCVQTAFGAFRLRGRRYWVCPCRAQSMDTVVFPLGEIIPRRTTPEVRYLFAELGASMPYRQASRILRTCGLGPMPASHSAIRRHTIALGRRLERNRACQDVPSESQAATSMVVGIDDTYVRHREPRESRHLQVTAGRIEHNGALGARFAFVSWTPIWNAEQVQGFLRQHGGGDRTKMRVVTDGDDGLRNLVQRSMSQTVDPQLDWFHIGMRLERLRKIVQMPVSYREFMENPNASRPAELLVARLRNALWRGRPWKALVVFTGLRAEMNRWQQEHPHQSPDATERALRAIEEFQGYVCGNRRDIPDYAKQRAAGHRISTAHVESVMNHLVNHRLGKKQQMRWSRLGAHYLLQVRTELLNGTLIQRYRSECPRFRLACEFTQAST